MTNKPELDIDELEQWCSSWVKYIAVVARHGSDTLSATNDAVKSYKNCQEDFLNATKQLLAQRVVEAKENLFDALIDVWKNPPKGIDMAAEDYRWGAQDIVECLQELKADALKNNKED